MARVGEQAPVAEGARAELATALEPGDDAVARQHLGDRVGPGLVGLGNQQRAKARQLGLQRVGGAE